MSEKWALITGASSGIGKATAQKLSELGYSLILIARRFEKLSELKIELENKHKVKIIAIKLDVQKREQIEHFIEENKDKLSKISLLINNAGLAKGVDKVQNANPLDYDQMINTNINGLVHFTRLVLPFMVKNSNGHIVNIGSVAGVYAYGGGAVYCGTKFFVRAFSEALRQDLFGTNIRVTNIEPGMTNSEFSKVRLGDETKANDVYNNMTPLSPSDIADTISWCITRPSHVNIQEIVIFPTDQASVSMVHRK